MTVTKRRTRRSKKFSYILYILYVLFLLVIMGNIMGSSMFLRLDDNARYLLLGYSLENIEAYNIPTWSFNQLFYRQFIYQGSIWVLGLSLIGIVANLFLVFLRGVIAGVNVIFLFSNLGLQAGMWAGLLWLIQYGLIIGVTILSGYFSIRFGILTIKILFFRRSPHLFKQHLVIYFYQLVIITILTLATSTVTFIIQPIVFRQIQNAVVVPAAQSIQTQGDFLVIELTP